MEQGTSEVPRGVVGPAALVGRQYGLQEPEIRGAERGGHRGARTG